jgi:cell fate regulator YaaT (PSP1 superfamily)
MNRAALVRYGTISEVGRFSSSVEVPLCRGQRVVIRTHRGLEIGTLLQDLAPSEEETRAEAGDFEILRAAADDDECASSRLVADARDQFSNWCNRINDWKLQLELIDLEWTLDGKKLILYVLNDRGPECTRLALQVAAAGLGIIEVQPVGPDGLIPQQQKSGCGSGGCGSDGHSGGCCH